VNSIGMIEFNSIPAGIEAGDAMLKAADVTLAGAYTACAGKYIVIVTGNVDAVNASVEAGNEINERNIVDKIVIANVEQEVISAIACCSDIDDIKALGVIETFSLASSVYCADSAVKAADVQLIEVRLGRGLGGKSFVLLSGDVSAVKHAVEAATIAYQDEGMIANTVVIPSPHKDMVSALM
jgi:microcompartment protein CcmL/EutN